MRYLVDFAGYSEEESDRIRGAIAKKKQAVMMEAFERIRKSCADRGWTEEAADIVCDQVLAFSRYSFNRSHSRCYSELGYITMYLKHYYPLEWWAAVLNTSNETKMRFFMTLLGDIIKPPSVASPSSQFTVLGKNIIAPISALKRVGPAAVNELISKGPFTDLEDYLNRVDHRKANAGAFAALVRGRATDCFLNPNAPYAAERKSLLDEYVKKRKCKKFTDSMYELDPMSIFFMERDTNKCFNKSLLSDPAIREIVLSSDPELKVTGNKGVPLMYGNTPVLANLKVAEGIVERKNETEVGMVLLYEGSKYKQIKSKKTGKSYDLLEVSLSDGFGNVTCSLWGFKKALGWNKNTLVWVKGTLSEGFKQPVSIKAKDINKLGE
jgi:DNA polymerase III alpha subunit